MGLIGEMRVPSTPEPNRLTERREHDHDHSTLTIVRLDVHCAVALLPLQPKGHTWQPERHGMASVSIEGRRMGAGRLACEALSTRARSHRLPPDLTRPCLR